MTMPSIELRAAGTLRFLLKVIQDCSPYMPGTGSVIFSNEERQNVERLIAQLEAKSANAVGPTASAKP